MACMEPYAQITGTSKLYIAPERTAPPDVDDEPSGDWVYLGETDGEQSIEHAGELTLFRVNERTGPVSAVRGEEDVIVTVTLVELTYENYARVLHSASNVTTASSPARKRMAFKRGDCPDVYALLMRGSADSPYGIYPAFNYIPRVVSSSEPTVTRAKDGRAALETIWTALEDSTQAEGDELGWAVAQTGA